MRVFKVESPSDPSLGPLYCRSVKEFDDFEATIGMYLCLPGEEEWLNEGTQVTITVVEMSEEEFEALPEFEGF